MFTIRRHLIAALLILSTATFVLPPHASAQLTDTQAFLADIAGQYRIVPNVVYHEANNHENTLDLYLPTNTSGPTPVLLMIHGGGWVAGTKEGQSLRLLPYLEMGWAVVNVSYRLVQVSRAPAAVEDCLCALQWIAQNADQYNFDLSKIVTTGNSAGGHLALTTALVPASSGLNNQCAQRNFSGPTATPSVPVAAVINWYGITDVQDLTRGKNAKGYAVEWMGNLINRRDIARLVSPLTHVSAETPPILTIHGDADAIVPYSHATRLHTALEGAGISNTLHTVPNGGHGGFNTNETIAIYESIYRFLNQHGL
jgi:acetyl esterase/lipase